MNQTTTDTDLSTRVVTHKLVVRLPEEWRTIYLTQQEADYMSLAINDRDVQNLTIRDARIVKNPPESYPRRWCHIYPIGPEEREKYDEKYFTEKMVERDRLKKEKEEKQIDAYIYCNAVIWQDCLHQAEIRFSTDKTTE